jgi:hypothetical protein
MLVRLGNIVFGDTLVIGHGFGSEIIIRVSFEAVLLNIGSALEYQLGQKGKMIRTEAP